MTPQEKAVELVNKFYCKKDGIGLMFNLNWSNAKQCALIAVDEILSVIDFSVNDEYWQKVKQEIEKL